MILSLASATFVGSGETIPMTARWRRVAVTAAIGKLDKAGQPVTVSGVAALAGVDRSYICSQGDLLAEIRQRRTTAPAPQVRRSTAERATLPCSKPGWPAHTTRSHG